MTEHLRTPDQTPTFPSRVLGSIAARAAAFKQGVSEIWDAGNFPTVFPTPSRENTTDVAESPATKAN